MQLPLLFLRFVRLYLQLKKQHAFNKYYLKPLLNDLEKEHAGRFSPLQRKKIEHYYTLFVPVILCGAYRQLQDVPFTQSERIRAVKMGIITPLYDDLFDEANLSPEQLFSLTLQPENYQPESFEERVIRSLHLQIKNEVPNPNGYIKAFANVLASQTESLQQKNPGILPSDLMRVTYKKSFDALNLYFQILQPVPFWFEDMIYPAAGLLQLSNDLFDIHKDVQCKIYTPANHFPDFTLLQQQFISEAIVFNNKVQQLPFPKKSQNIFLFTLHSIIARGYTALLQLKQVWEKNGGNPNPEQLLRNDIVCDMQKPANLIRWIKYTGVLCRLK